MKLLFPLLLLLAAQLHAQTDSAAMGIWKPTRPGECTQEQHDAYFAVGPDNKRYPVWHPPVDPSGCFFGHEHGHDPALSPLNDRGPVLFGYVNEQHTLQNAMGHRHEDHVGHKVVVANRVPYGATGSPTRLVCDILTKFHQGTHSADALTNNLHEQSVRMSCDDGMYANVQLLSMVGPAGQIVEPVTKLKIEVGPAVPSDSPRIGNPLNPGKSYGARQIPTTTNIHVARPNFFEQWRTQNTIDGPDGNRFRFAFYWNVSLPSRYYDPEQPNRMGRSIDACWLTNPLTNDYLVISNPCASVRNSEEPINWDDPASPFNGTKRGLRPDSFTWRNANGVTFWYTDALGMNPQRKPCAGCVLQEVSIGTHYPLGQYSFRGAGGGIDGTATHPSVHAPN
jgi:hypothetical protein